MIVDTSAIIAIVTGEPEGPGFAERIAAADTCSISAGSRIEATVVLVRRFPHVAAEKLDDLLRDANIAVAPVTAEQAAIGVAAYRRYGRGSQHDADLNFGDCFAYALSKATGEPLLFKGDDFARTDVAVA